MPDPSGDARTKAEAEAALRARIAYLAREMARAEAALSELVYTPRRPRPRPGGTYELLGSYIRYLRAHFGPGRDITVAAATKWMFANGWKTTAEDPYRAASTALSNLARHGELRRVRQGIYQEPESPAEGGDG